MSLEANTPPTNLLEYFEGFLIEGSVKVSSKQTGDIILLLEHQGYESFTLHFSQEQYRIFCDYISHSGFVSEKFMKASCEVVEQANVSSQILNYRYGVSL